MRTIRISLFFLYYVFIVREKHESRRSYARKQWPPHRSTVETACVQPIARPCKGYATKQPIVSTHPTYLLFHTLWMYKIILFPWHFISIFFTVLITLRSYNNITWCPLFVLFNFELASLYHSCSNRSWGSTTWFRLSWPLLEVLSLPVLSAWKDERLNMKRIWKTLSGNITIVDVNGAIPVLANL